jgi:hypothetical protein
VLTGDSIRWTFHPRPFHIGCHEYVETMEQVCCLLCVCLLHLCALPLCPLPLCALRVCPLPECPLPVCPLPPAPDVVVRCEITSTA